MKFNASLVWTLVAVIGLLGCESTEDPGDDDNNPTGGAGMSGTGNGGTSNGGTGNGGSNDPNCGLLPEADNGDLVMYASEASNYGFASELTTMPQKVKPSSNLTFDWSKVTSDFIEQPVDPTADIDMVTAALWALTPAEFDDKLNRDLLFQDDTRAIVLFDNAGAPQRTTTAMLDQFLSGDRAPIDFDTEVMPYLDADDYPADTYLYSVMAASGDILGAGTRMIAVFQLDPTSDNTTVVIDSSTVSLTYDADLMSLTPIQVPLGTPYITIDWEDMNGMRNALGETFGAYDITNVLIARYSASPAELEQDFLSLEYTADEGHLYNGEVFAGASFSLFETMNEAGEAFPGFDDQGTWIVALRCGGCNNPAPWYLTRVESCASTQ